jgi:hypothetical protein
MKTVKNGTAQANYASSISYAPQGAIAAMTLGNGLLDTHAYNARLQPTLIQAGSLLTLGLNYGTTQNNGNLLTQTIARPGKNWTQTYSYSDGKNRLTGGGKLGRAAFVK